MRVFIAYCVFFNPGGEMATGFTNMVVILAIQINIEENGQLFSKTCYIGETSRHFSTRIKEHTVSDKNSHIFKNLSQFPACKGMYTPSCFRILDSANSSIDLKLKEALYISKNQEQLPLQLPPLLICSFNRIRYYSQCFRLIFWLFCN